MTGYLNLVTCPYAKQYSIISQNTELDERHPRLFQLKSRHLCTIQTRHRIQTGDERHGWREALFSLLMPFFGAGEAL